jgi:RES domain-containing protein
MPRAWRIIHEDYLATAFSGEGARIAGGRWNSEGFSVVYTASALSLALLEIIVHLEVKKTLKWFKAVPVTFSETLVRTVSPGALPLMWNSPQPLALTRTVGDTWVQQAASAILCVPSAVVPNESNYLLNPNHPDFHKIDIGEIIDLPADPRILEKLK